MQNRINLRFDPSRISVPLLCTMLVAVIDQGSKYLIRTTVSRYEAISVIKGFFQIVYARNTGVAFGFLASLDPKIINPILSIANIIIMIFLLCLVLLEEFSLLSRAAFGLILGGAAGNLIDRLLLGFVVDFLDFYIGSAHWPAFNVADAAITIGVVLMIADTLLLPRKRKAEA
jgi:signal peptidase II